MQTRVILKMMLIKMIIIIYRSIPGSNAEFDRYALLYELLGRKPLGSDEFL